MPTQNVGQRISNLLETIKPYRELIGWGTTLVVALSAGVSFAISYFATQSQLHDLDCRVARNVALEIIPLQTDTIGVKIDWRTSELQKLAREANEGERISALVADINKLTSEQSQLAYEIRQRVDKAAEECNK